MALEVNGYNAAFNAFAHFAQEQVAEGKDATVARIGGIAANAAITSAAGDKAYALTRSADAKAANNAARTLFMNAVAEMFGGEANIPANVKGAMKLSDFGKGKPLTARRILAVKQAVDEFRGDMLPVRIDAAKAKAMIATSLATIAKGKEIDKENADFAEMCLVKYGSGLPEKTAKVLCNFIIKTALNLGADEEEIENVAKDMKGWREFDFGDRRQTQLGAKIASRMNTYISDTIADPKMFLANHPDVAEQFYKDTDRGEWNIGGQNYPMGSNQDEMVAKFLDTVKTPNARKFISKLFNQTALADVETLLVKSDAVVGDAFARRMKTENLYKLKGGNMFVSRNFPRDGFGITSDADSTTYTLEMSEDGTKAYLTVSVVKNLSANGSKYNEHKIGTATVSEKITIDIANDQPKVANVTFAQTFTADSVIIDPDRWENKANDPDLAAENPLIIEG